MSTNNSSVRRLDQDGREIILIGTAHVSQKSVDLVHQLIEEEQPDLVCVELDQKRYEALADSERWKDLDLKKIIKDKQLSTLMINLILASYQKKLGDKLGVKPGAELMEATQHAMRLGIPVELCDRDVRVTMRRAWKSTSFLRKGYLLASLIASLFHDSDITEENIEALKETDALSELMIELGTAMPELKRVLIDERDTYISEKIKNGKGQKIVAVVGAGHLQGIVEALTSDRSDQMEEISSIPPVSPIWKTVGWLVPVLIIGSLCLIGLTKGVSVAGGSFIYWVLANGIPSSLGAAAGLSHPLTILAAFLGAPLTSLTPVIGAGYLCAFVQAVAQPPVVHEFETVLEDMANWRRWWNNKLLKVFLAFILPGFGSMIGTWIGGYEIISTLVG